MSFKSATIRSFLLDRLELRPFEGAQTRPSWGDFERLGLDGNLLETTEALGASMRPKLYIPNLFFENEFFIIQFDDEQHFNKYRTITLRSELYEKLETGFDLGKYQRFCRLKAAECMKAGRSKNEWTHPRLEQKWGPADDPGELGYKGAPNWKERAFQDLLIDTLPLFNKDLLVFRISIWDELFIQKQIVPLNKVLMQDVPEWESVLEKYLAARIPGVEIKEKPKETEESD